MKFYKLRADFNLTKTEEQEFTTNLETKAFDITADFNGENSNTFCFISNIDKKSATIGIITKNNECDPIALSTEFLMALDVSFNVLRANEITISSINSLLRNACRNCLLRDDDEILERFELDAIIGRGGHQITYGENLVTGKKSKKALFDNAYKYFMKGTLLPELERIYTGRRVACVKGHPVHYIVETDDRDTRREVYKTILEALYNNDRLEHRRYAFLDFNSREQYSKIAYEKLYNACVGGAVVVRYFSDDDFDDETASSQLDTIENICEIAKAYRNQVLTVICFPRECKQLKNVFFEHLGTMAFINVKEDLITGDEIKTFFLNKAKENHIRTDKKLFELADSEKLYLACELSAIFEEWYNKKLKITIYPQYKEINGARQESLKAAPKGTAYEELIEMIGLSDAKSVIKKALDYYKMQKLYEEKGVKNSNPAMHMIFTGNPGTAKTSVARLFARIMKENGLLSKGQLVEVGRGDLVGKYTGWTAKTVQSKFEEAKGGVLFIDEAYSLVDDRNGSYGDEAINTIVQEMENHRADIVVIFAGYPDKMEGFLQKNPGLRSRIAFHVPFADYDTSELCQIARLISKKNGMRINDEGISKLEKAFSVAKKETDFGNGRYVRNLFEQAKMNQASRLLKKDFDSISTDEILTITAEDIIIPSCKKCEMQKIGFC